MSEYPVTISIDGQRYYYLSSMTVKDAQGYTWKRISYQRMGNRSVVQAKRLIFWQRLEDE